MRVEISEAAAKFIGGRGGAFYIWSDSAGLTRSATKRPASVAEWVTDDIDGIEINVAAWLGAVQTWRVELLRFPWSRLDVSTELSLNGAQSGIDAFL